MKQLVFILLGLAIAVIAWFVLTAFSAALMKQDRARSSANVSLIWNRLDDYRTTHGSYPPAQDMTSLLKTLNLSDGAKMIPITADDRAEAYSSQILAPILADGEIVGGLILLSRESGLQMTDVDRKVAETTASIIGRQMEQ